MRQEVSLTCGKRGVSPVLIGQMSTSEDACHKIQILIELVEAQDNI
jgi:hypothetical protein